MSAYFDCPECGCPENFVPDSRPVQNGIRRRRECIECGHRWTTYEYAKDLIVKPLTKVPDDSSDTMQALLEIKAYIEKLIKKEEQKRSNEDAEPVHGDDLRD